MPVYLQRLNMQLLQKATRLASYEALNFDWLVLMLKSQVGDLVHTALSVLLNHLEPSKNNRWNQKRDDWINSVRVSHLQVIETCCDIAEELNHPDSYRYMAT